MRLDDDLQDAGAALGRTAASAARRGVVDVPANRTVRPRAIGVSMSSVLAILALAACSSSGSTTSSQSSADSANDGASSDDASDDSTTGGDSDAGGGTADGDEGDDGSDFIGPPSDIPEIPMCDPLDHDCPEGEKCVPVVLDPTSNAWDGNVCVPAGDQPIGAPCTFVEGGVNGQDTCAGPGWCWAPDPNTGVGQCIEQCSWVGGVGGVLGCPISGEECTANGSGILSLCLPSCDPLVDHCWEGAQCVPDYYGGSEPVRFVCVPPGTAMPGGPGDPCSCGNCCANGNICEDPNQVGLDNCPEVNPASQACCTALCDINLPEPDLTCAEAGLVGTVCVAIYPQGTPEPLGKLGQCVLPP